jgi:hypothetical protein
MKVECMGKFINSGAEVLIVGNNSGRLLVYDDLWDQDLISENIAFRVKSGIIYPDNSPHTVKGFKTAGIIYKTDTTNVSISSTFRIDNFPSQVSTISQEISAELLGTTFTLGTSVLGAESVILPEYYSVDGYGYGCTIDIQSTTYVEIYGFIIIYESAGDQQSVIRSN